SVAATVEAPATDSSVPVAGVGPLCVRLKRLNAKDTEALAAEMALLGQVLHQERGADSLAIWLDTTATADDLQAVCCFIVSDDQVEITREPVPTGASATGGSAPAELAAQSTQQAPAAAQPAAQPEQQASAPAKPPAGAKAEPKAEAKG